MHCFVGRMKANYTNKLLSFTEIGSKPIIGQTTPIKRRAFKHHSNVIQTSFTRISGKSSIETSFKEFLNCFYHSYIIQLSFNCHSDWLPLNHHSEFHSNIIHKFMFSASIETSFRIPFIHHSHIHV